MGNRPYFLLGRYEGFGIWEVIAVPFGQEVSPGFRSLVAAHRHEQLSPREEDAFQDLGLERAVFFHVRDVARAVKLN